MFNSKSVQNLILYKFAKGFDLWNSKLKALYTISHRHITAPYTPGISHRHIAPACRSGMSQRYVVPACRRILFEELELNVQQQKCSELYFVHVCLKVWPLKLKAKGSVYNIPPACRSGMSHRHVAAVCRSGMSHRYIAPAYRTSRIAAAYCSGLIWRVRAKCPTAKVFRIWFCTSLPLGLTFNTQS